MNYPKGKLIAIGGAEHKGTELEADGFQHKNLNFIELGILRRVVEEAGGTFSNIEVITTASMIPLKMARITWMLLEKLVVQILGCCISALGRMQ